MAIQTQNEIYFCLRKEKTTGVLSWKPSQHLTLPQYPFIRHVRLPLLYRRLMHTAHPQYSSGGCARCPAAITSGGAYRLPGHGTPGGIGG